MVTVSVYRPFSPPDLEDRKAAEAEDTTENELSDPEEEELTDSQQTSKLSELYSTTVPSVDSAMESWDGSGMDAGYGSQGELGENRSSFVRGSVSDLSRLVGPAGTYSHQAAGIALHPHEWRSAKQPHSTTPPPGRRKNYPFSDGGFSEDDWDRPPG